MDSRRRLRLWIGLGTAALFTTQAGLVAAQGAAPPAASPPAMQGGEGGEGGEGGVDADRALADPVEFTVALDVMAAHVIAGRDVYGAEPGEAAEMFAHAIAEVYAVLEDGFARLGVTPFQAQMERATTLAQDHAPSEAVSEAASAILAALRAAEAHAPPPGPTPAVQLKATAEMVDRAAMQFGVALRERDRAEPYLDGYGLARAAALRGSALLPGLRAGGKAEVAARLEEVLGLLAAAYPTAARPAHAPAVDPGALLAASSRLSLAIQ